MKARDGVKHRIRLRGPWNVQKISHPDDAEIAVLHFPQCWKTIPGGDDGTHRFTRRFGRPTGIGPRQTVWLEVASSAAGRAVLNEQDLGEITAGTQSFDVTPLLGDGNQIELELRRPDGDVADEVILEAAIVIETRSDPA
jgi:hypothetical protein